MFYKSNKFKYAVAACGLLIAGGLVFAQAVGGISVEDLVKQAQARADARKGSAQSLIDGADGRTDAYQQQALDLAKGNRDRLRKGLAYMGPEIPRSLYDDAGTTGADNGVIYVAVSLSMPAATLKQIVRDANKAGAAVVIQGPVNGSFKQTFKMMRAVYVEGEEGGIQIDPRVFQQYNITRVPAVIVAKEGVQDCPEGLDCVRTATPFDIVRGNITLGAALKLLADKGDAAPDIAQTALNRLGA